MKKVHPDFDVWQFIDEWERERKLAKEALEDYAKEKDYRLAAEWSEYHNTVRAMLTSLTHYAKTGEQL
jgi:hypothetical protein